MNQKGESNGKTEETKPEVKALNLQMKLVEVRKSIDGFTKDKSGYNYSYISGTQVLAKIKQKMDELYLLLYPEILSQDFEGFPHKDKYGKDKHDFIVYGDMSYKWVNAEKPEEEILIPWKYTGQQADISQAFGTGLTYSERYFLLKFFGVPTDADDPDAKKPDTDKDQQKGNQSKNQKNNNQQYGNNQKNNNQQYGSNQKNNNYQKNNPNQQSNNNYQKPNNQQQPNNNTGNNNKNLLPITKEQKTMVNEAVKDFAALSKKSSGDVIAALEKTQSVGAFGDVSGMTTGQAVTTIALLNKWINERRSAQTKGANHQ